MPQFQIPKQLEGLVDEMGMSEAYQSTISSFNSLAPEPLTTSLLSEDDSSLSSTRSTNDRPPSPTFSIRPPSSSATSIGLRTSMPALTQCPICAEALPAAITDTLRADFPTAPRLSLRQQCRLHVAHLNQNMHTLAENRGYPIPDWAALPARLDREQAGLAAELLTPDPHTTTAASRRRSAARASAAAAAAIARPELLIKEFHRPDNAPLLGYYGTRGARIVAEWLMQRFVAEMKRCVAADARVGAAGGLPKFVQGTLAPRILRALVEGDLAANKKMEKGARGRLRVERKENRRAGDKVDVAELARFVLEESADVGRLLGEDEDDEVQRGEEDEDG